MVGSIRNQDSVCSMSLWSLGMVTFNSGARTWLKADSGFGNLQDHFESLHELVRSGGVRSVSIKDGILF